MKKRLFYIILFSGITASLFSFISLLDEHILTRTDGFSYLSTESVRIFGEGDEFIDFFFSFSVISMYLGFLSLITSFNFIKINKIKYYALASLCLILIYHFYPTYVYFHNDYPVSIDFLFILSFFVGLFLVAAAYCGLTHISKKVI